MAVKNVSWLSNPTTAVVQNAGNIVATAMHNKTVKELAKQQNQWNFEQWNRQNAYDSPSAQMQRYVEAGLNPNLIYGSANGNGTPSAPAVSGFENLATPHIDMSPMLYASQIRKNNAEADSMLNKINIDNRLTDAQIERMIHENNLTDVSVEKVRSDIQVANATIKNLTMDLDVKSQQIANMKEEERSKYLENLFSDKTFDFRVGLLQEQYNLSKQEAESYQRVINAVIAERMANTTYLNSSAALNDTRRNIEELLYPKEAALKDALIGFYNASANQSDASAAYFRVLKELQDNYGSSVQVANILSQLVNVLGIAK